MIVLHYTKGFLPGSRHDDKIICLLNCIQQVSFFFNSSVFAHDNAILEDPFCSTESPTYQYKVPYSTPTQTIHLCPSSLASSMYFKKLTLKWLPCPSRSRKGGYPLDQSIASQPSICSNIFIKSSLVILPFSEQQQNGGTISPLKMHSGPYGGTSFLYPC